MDGSRGLPRAARSRPRLPERHDQPIADRHQRADPRWTAREGARESGPRATGRPRRRSSTPERCRSAGRRASTASGRSSATAPRPARRTRRPGGASSIRTLTAAINSGSLCRHLKIAGRRAGFMTAGSPPLSATVATRLRLERSIPSSHCQGWQSRGNMFGVGEETARGRHPARPARPPAAAVITRTRRSTAPTAPSPPAGRLAVCGRSASGASRWHFP